MNYYPFHIGDYASATRHLSWDEDMAYRRLIDAYYIREAPLPSDMRQVYRLVCASTEAQRIAVDTVLSEFFMQTPEGWWNGRCEAEIEAYRIKSEKASKSAQARWRNAKAMPTDSERNANASTDVCERIETSCEGNAPKTNPKTNISTTDVVDKRKRSVVQKPELVSQEVWESFCAVRKAKRAAITQIAVNRIESEAFKAGLSLDQALTICCERGWQSFQADWIKDAGRSNGRPLTAAENYVAQKNAMRGNDERTITGSAVRIA